MYPMGRILIVDSDNGSVEHLQQLLEAAGYYVRSTNVGAAVLDILRDASFDLVILDRILVDGDGLEVCREIRQRSAIPLIIVSLLSDVHHRIIGLRAGADDYMSKPFDPSELLARVWVAIRRMRQSQSLASIVSTPELVLDTIGNRVTLMRDGRAISLTPIETRLLHYLVTNAGRSMTRNAIMIKVWGYAFEQQSNQLDVYIARLRTKIEEDAHQPQMLQTIRGIGYCFQVSRPINPQPSESTDEQELCT